MEKVIIAYFKAGIFTQLVVVFVILVALFFVGKYLPLLVSAAKAKFKSKKGGGSGDANATVIIAKGAIPDAKDGTEVLLTMGQLVSDLKSAKNHIATLEDQLKESGKQHKQIIDMVKKVGVVTKEIYQEINNVMNAVTHKENSVISKIFSSFEED